MREATSTELAVCRDLGKKAAEDSRQAIMRVLDLAAVVGGPSAVASVAMTATGSAMMGLATIFVATRTQDRVARKLSIEDVVVTKDDFMLACLYVAAGFGASLGTDDARDVPAKAAEMFRKLTGQEPEVSEIFSQARGVSP